VRASLFERREPVDEKIVAAYVAAVRHLRDTGAMAALFSRLIRSFNLPPPINIDGGYFRLVLPTNDLLSRMDARRDLVQREDWDYLEPYDGPEPTIIDPA